MFESSSLFTSFVFTVDCVGWFLSILGSITLVTIDSNDHSLMQFCDYDKPV